MKQRLFAYLILLPLFAFVMFTNVSDYLKYIAYVCIPVIIALIAYAYIKTKAFYKTKKCLAFLIVGLFIGLCNVSAVQAQYYDPYMDGMGDPAMSYYLQQQEQLRQERAQATRVLRDQKSQLQDKIAQLSKKFPRTTAEEKELQDALTRYASIQRSLGEFPCPTTKELYDEANRDCWACDMAELFIEAGDKVASKFYQMDKTEGYAFSLLVIGFIFWLVAHVLKLLMSFGVGDIGSFFTELFVKLLLVGGISILLLQPMYKVVDFAISPFFLISSAMTNSIIETSDQLKLQTQNRIDDKMATEFGPAISCPYCNALTGGMEDFNGPAAKPTEKISTALNHPFKKDERVVSPIMRNALLCTICTIYQATAPTAITGQFIACSAKKKTSSVLGVPFYTDLGAVVTGYTMVFSFFLISALFAFYLIDTFMRLAITLVLLPFLIVAWAFKSTQKYTKKGFEVLLHSVATYIMIALFLSIVIQVFYVMLGEDASQIVSLTAANNVDDIVELAGWMGNSAHGGRIFLCSLGIFFISFFCLSKVDEYVSELTGIGLSNGGGFQATMSTVGAGAAVVGTISKLYDQDWKKSGNESGNSAQDKAAQINQWGDDIDKDGTAEQTTDEIADTTGEAVEKTGDGIAKAIENACDAIGDGICAGGDSCMQAGTGLCSTGIGAIVGIPLILLGLALKGVGYTIKGAGRAAGFTVRQTAKVAGYVTKTVIKQGSRLIIKTLKKTAKAIAKNKYFNKTVGLIWQTGEDIKNTPQNIANRYNAARQKVRNAHAAYHRYQRRRKKR